MQTPLEVESRRGSGAGKQEKARGEIKEGGKGKELGVSGLEGEVEASLGGGGGGVDGRGLAAPPQSPPARMGGAEGRGVKCGLTWSDWWVLWGLPAIFSPAARGVGAETKPNKSEDTVQRHRGSRGDLSLLTGKRAGDSGGLADSGGCV